jgi:hypothetical protein
MSLGACTLFNSHAPSAGRELQRRLLHSLFICQRLGLFPFRSLYRTRLLVALNAQRNVLLGAEHHPRSEVENFPCYLYHLFYMNHSHRKYWLKFWPPNLMNYCCCHIFQTLLLYGHNQGVTILYHTCMLKCSSIRFFGSFSQ